MNDIIKIPEMCNAEIKNISDWEVMTPTGFQSFSGVKKITLSKYRKLKIKVSNNKIIIFKCSENHKLKLQNKIFKEAFQLLNEDVLMNGYTILSNELINEDIDLYDILNVDNGNEYIIENGIINHNCAHIDYINEIWTSAQSTLSTGGQCIALSTPNGINNWFHKNYSEADSGKGKFHPIKLHWSVHPDRNQQWRDAQDILLGKRAAAQECDCVDFNTEITVQDIVTSEIKVIKIGDLYEEFE